MGAEVLVRCSCPSQMHCKIKYGHVRKFLSTTPWSRVLPYNLTGPQLVKKFPEFYGTGRFFTAFTKIPPPLPILNQVDPVHAPHNLSFRRSILLLSPHLPLGLPSGRLFSGFSTKSLYAPFLAPIRATCSVFLSCLDFITRLIFGEEYRA